MLKDHAHTTAQHICGNAVICNKITLCAAQCGAAEPLHLGMQGGVNIVCQLSVKPNFALCRGLEQIQTAQHCALT